MNSVHLKKDYKVINGEPEGIRTPDPRLRRALLYPAELQAHLKSFTFRRIPLGQDKYYYKFYRKSIMNFTFFEKTYKNQEKFGKIPWKWLKKDVLNNNIYRG